MLFADPTPNLKASGMTRKILLLTLTLGVLCCLASAKAEDRVDRNLSIIVEAARKLEFSPASDGYAYLLINKETVLSPVAIVFGYVDNSAACEEIAQTLTNAPRSGTFQCQPVF